MVVGSIVLVLLIESSLTFSVCCVVLSLFLLPDVDDDEYTLEALLGTAEMYCSTFSKNRLEYLD